MRRPIAEFLTISVQAGAETERAVAEHQTWQILRRKQGYVTHRMYERCGQPLQRLVYSEWESKKALDGARQHLHGTPLMRRARATLAAPPQQLVVELVGPITSTKGLDLPESAVAACGITQAGTPPWRELEEQLPKALSEQPGHVTHVLFRGFEDQTLSGLFSHWADSHAFEQSGSALAGISDTVAAFTGALDYVLYSPRHD